MVLSYTFYRLKFSITVRDLNLIDVIEDIFDIEVYLQQIYRMWPFLVFADILCLVYRSFRMLMLA